MMFWELTCLVFVLLVRASLSEDQMNETSPCKPTVYNVQQLYQACPPKGPIIQNIKKDEDKESEMRRQNIDANLQEVKDELNLMKQKVESLESKLEKTDQPASSFHDHNVTRTNGTYPADCSELYDLGYRCTGVYWIKPSDDIPAFQAFCELSYEGWTVIVRRFNGQVDFYRNWTDYKQGFGSVFGEHWLGNDRLHHLTKRRTSLRIDFLYTGARVGNSVQYFQFKVDSESTNYTLHINGYAGNAGFDALKYHDGQKFTTRDRDNDPQGRVNCAQYYKGAFWYHGLCPYHTCAKSWYTGTWSGTCHNFGVPTALYIPPGCSKDECIMWKKNRPIQSLIWKIKPVGLSGYRPK